MKHVWIYAIVAVVITSACLWLATPRVAKAPQPSNSSTPSTALVKTVSNFDDCVTAGNPVLESYPPQCKTKDGQTFTQNIGNEMSLSDQIRISSPRPNDIITSPLMVNGEARGPWFFEAQFNVKLLDGNNKVIATGIAKTTGEWMTNNFVPFSNELTYQIPETKNGTLVLEKANPSGMLEKAQQLIVPIKFN